MYSTSILIRPLPLEYTHYITNMPIYQSRSHPPLGEGRGGAFTFIILHIPKTP